MRNLLVVLMIISGCKMGQKTSLESLAPSAHLIVYKTTKNYNDRVPVLLSGDKSRVVVYPDPKDISSNQTPIQLKNGYLLDRRGISKNVAISKYTYTEYAALKSLPDVQDLYSNLTDKEPLTELCDCGLKSSYKDAVKEINALIIAGKLNEKCKSALKPEKK